MVEVGSVGRLYKRQTEHWHTDDSEVGGGVRGWGGVVAMEVRGEGWVLGSMILNVTGQLKM